MTLVLTRQAYAAVGEHATADYPAEAVGLLVGPAGGPVAGAHRLVNEESYAPGRKYRVGRDALDAAPRHLDAAGLSVLGIYHSHCDRAAGFSEVDRGGAAAGVVQVIVAVSRTDPAGPAVREVRAWVLPGDGPESQVPIEVLR